LKMRLQVGSADELTIDIMARDNIGRWRPDMGVWQKGAKIIVALGYDGDLDPIQKFTIVSTTVQYPQEGAEEMTIRAVSDLARALHNNGERVYREANDTFVIDDVCEMYGWTNGVEADLANTRARIKAKGTNDLEFLRLIANEALIGGPRLDVYDTLLMPEPVIGNHVYTRGRSFTDGARPLLNYSPSREGGADAVQVQITAWDPDQHKFVDIVYQADEFGAEPKIVYNGPAAVQDRSTRDNSTRGLTLKVIEVRGHGENEKKDVIATGRFLDEANAEDLAKRWFELREKLSRWANIVVPGHTALVPYIAVNLEGDMANVDKGLWLPTVVEHDLSESGWICRLTAVRVVQETTVTAV